MPKLLFFIPCERTSVDETDKTLSLISVLEQVQLPAPPTDGDFLGAFRWSIVVAWFRLPQDEGKTYEQRTYIVLPDGRETFEAIAEIPLTERVNRGNVRIVGFPISQAGECLLRLAVREKGKEESWNQVAEYPIEVIHLEPPRG